MKVRVVLLARHRRGWWEELGKERSEIEHLLAASPPPREVPALAPSEQRQQAAFSAATVAFADALEREAPVDVQPPELTEDLAARALYLHMAALLGVLGEAPKTVPELLGEILAHERRFWCRELERRELLEEIEIEEVDAVVAGLVLCNGVRDRKGGCEIVGRLLGLSPKTPIVKKIVTILHRLYEGGEGAYIEPLQPDLLGEALVDVALEREPDLLDRVLVDADDAIRERLLTVLTRLAQQEATATRESGVRWLERALTGHIEDLAEPALQVVLETGEPADKVLATTIREVGSTELVHRLLKPFDAAGTWIAVAHREIAAAATERALELVPEDEEHTPDKAMLLTKLGGRLAPLNREQALKTSMEAVKVNRKLARDRPDTSLPVLAGSLNNLGTHLFDLGRREEALQATQESVQILERLARQQPEAFLTELARSLTSLSVVLASLGHPERALAATQKAFQIRTEFAQQLPEAFLPELAGSLNNLGRDLADLGDHEQALAAARKAVEIHRQLARDRPAVFLPDLATSLNNLGSDLAALGRQKQALEATQEAAEIRRQLARQRPDVFLPNLAASLNNLGNRLSALGRREQALDAANEAVRTLLPFFCTLPAAFSTQMKNHYRNYLKRAEESGQEPDAELVGEVEEIFAALETSD